MAYVAECDDFYLHLSSSDSATGNPANFTVATQKPRTLTGQWKLALKEISFTKWDKERSYNDEMEFVIVAPPDKGREWQDHYDWLIREKIARPIYVYSQTAIQGLPYAAVVSFYTEPNHPEKGTARGPEGQFENAEDYVREVNNRLHDLRGHFHADAYFYLLDTNDSRKKVGLSWNYAVGRRRQVGIVPILGARNRRLLGIPQEYNSTAMIELLKETFAAANKDTPFYPDLHPGYEGFTQKMDNMFVLCSVVDTTGIRTDMEGKILRVIPNRNEKQGAVVHWDFTEDYYIVSPISSFFSVSLRLVSSRDYRDFNLDHPTTFTLHFMPVNQCKPVPKRVDDE